MKGGRQMEILAAHRFSGKSGHRLSAPGKSVCMKRSALLEFLVVIVCLGTTLGNWSSSSTSAQSSDDVQAAVDAAYFYSYLESIGDYNTEYDYIHPDARAVIPRAAVTGWFLENYWPRQPQPATITNVHFVSWTWPVTGVTYPYTAEVSFTQVFWDGGANTIVNDVVRLVQDRNGVWRWFFGRNLEFVNSVISQYVPLPPTTSFTGYGWIDGTANDLNAYWVSFFKATTVAYSTPRVIQFDQATLTSCGIADPWVQGAHYCASDQTVYLNPFELDAIQSNLSIFAAQLVLAHEWGHHIQQTMGSLIGPSDPAIELQADCLAGAWARDVATRYGLTEPDLVAAVGLFIQIGDSAHGSGTLRTKMLLDGFYDGSRACFDL